MTIRSAIPYLILHGRAREALSFYERALGANVEGVTLFGEGHHDCPDARTGLVMHASLRIGEALLMMSDGPDEASPSGSAVVSVALDFDAEGELRRCFEVLVAGGSPVVPPHHAPWGAVFAAAIDRFGVSWMLNSTKASGPSRPSA
jgi:PhnB protein